MKRIKLVDNTKLTLNELIMTDPEGTPRVMTLLRGKLLKPEDVPEELLYLTDKCGTSVLDVCVERFREWVKVRKSRETTDLFVPRALALAEASDNRCTCYLPLHFRKLKNILKIVNPKNEYSVAHVLASQKLLPEESMTEDILKLEDIYRYSVAYEVAQNGNLPVWARSRKDILILNDGYDTYVAHKLAEHNTLPIETMTPDILKLENTFHVTVLDIFICKKYLTPEILALPWDDKKYVFQLIQDSDFRKRSPVKQHLTYIDQTLYKFITTYITQEFISSSSQYYQDSER